MPVDFEKVFGNAFRYAFSFNRILPFILINIALMGTFFLLLNYAVNISGINVVTGMPTLGTNVGTLLAFIIGFMVLVLIIALVKLFFVGVIVDDAKHYPRKKVLSKSFDIAKKKYLSIVFATIMVAIITSIVATVSGIIGYVPYIGGLLTFIVSIVVSLIFLFIIPFIIISKKGAVESIKSSYKLFMKNKLDVFVFGMLLLVIGFILLIVAFIPFVISTLPMIVSFYQLYVQGATDFTSIITLLKGNMAYLAIGSIVASVVLAYLTVFQEAAKTFFFLQKKRK